MDEYELMEHARRPYHNGGMCNPTAARAVRNSLCGDSVELQLRISGDRVEEAWFEGYGCTVSRGAASLLCQQIEGQTLVELRTFDEQAMLSLLRFPLTPFRQRCGLLALRALNAILDDYPVSSDGP